MQDGGEVQMLSLVEVNGAVHGEQVRPADGFVQGAEAQGSQDFPRFLRHEAKVVDDVFRLAAELGSQSRVLRGDAHRARVFMAPAEHGAADGDQNGSAEAEFLRSQQGRHDDVPPGAQLAVHLEPDAGAELVEHKRLLRFRQTQFPRQSGVLDAGERGGARTAVVAADHNHVRVGLHHSGGHRADAHLGDELDGDAGVRVGVPQVVDQLGQVFNGVDVMVRRGRDEADIRHGMAQPGDVRVHLVRRELAALSGLGALGHLDLELGGVAQIVDGHAEASARHLLDRAVAHLAPGVGFVAGFILAPFTGVAFGSYFIHRDGDGFMGLRAEGTQGHGPGDEAAQDGIRAFHFLQRDGVRGSEFKQAAQGAEVLRLVVAVVRKFPVFPFVIVANGGAEGLERLRVPEVVFSALPALVLAARIQPAFLPGVLRGALVAFRSYFLQPDAAHAADGAREEFVNQFPVQPHGLEQLGGAVAAQGGNAHLGHDFKQPLVNGVDVVAGGLHHVQRAVLRRGQGGDRRQS